MAPLVPNGMSNSARLAGVSAASLAMRLAAGCRRICSASNDRVSPRAITSSPSTTKRRGWSAATAATTSGKYRDNPLPDRACNSTRAPSRMARQRKPSHLGSYFQPASRGSSATSRASIVAKCCGIVALRGFDAGMALHPSFLLADAPQLLDQHAHVLRVIHRHRDEVHPAAGERGFERRREALSAFHAGPLHAVGPGIGDEVGIAESHPEIGKSVGRLLPADHAVGI